MGQGTWGEETEYTEAMSEQLPLRKTFIGELQSCFLPPWELFTVLSDVRNVCIDFLLPRYSVTLRTIQSSDASSGDNLHDMITMSLHFPLWNWLNGQEYLLK